MRLVAPFKIKPLPRWLKRWDMWHADALPVPISKRIKTHAPNCSILAVLVMLRLMVACKDGNKKRPGCYTGPLARLGEGSALGGCWRAVNGPKAFQFNGVNMGIDFVAKIAKDFCGGAKCSIFIALPLATQPVQWLRCDVQRCEQQGACHGLQPPIRRYFHSGI